MISLEPTSLDDSLGGAACHCISLRVKQSRRLDANKPTQLGMGPALAMSETPPSSYQAAIQFVWSRCIGAQELRMTTRRDGRCRFIVNLNELCADDNQLYIGP